MASEVAKQMAARLFVEGGTKPRRAARLVLAFDGDEKFRGHSGWSELPVSDELDVRLQEVRDALEGLATKRYASFAGQHCWCDVPGTATRPEGDAHVEKCQRTRQLAERLRVG